MVYEKLAIITDSKETTLKVIELFGPYMAVNVYDLLCYDIVLLDTCNSAQDWIDIIKEDLDIDVKVIPIEELKFKDDAPEGFNKGVDEFIKKADISDDINYFLDLVTEKGGVNWLTAKERQRLHELSGHNLS